MNQENRPIGFTIFALLIGIFALAHLMRITPEQVLAVKLLTVGVAIAGLATSIALWRMERWAAVAFSVWAVLVLARQVTRELVVEGVQWEEVLLGFGLMAVVLGVCVAYIRSQLRTAT